VFSQLMETSPRAAKTRTDKFNQLHDLLIPHMEAEENTLYPFMMETEGKSMALEAVEEHNAAKHSMTHIDELAPDDEHWLPRLKVLHSLIEHHIEEEENEILPMAEKMMSDEQVKSMSGRFSDVKKSTMAAAW